MTVRVLLDATELTGQSAHSGIGTYVRGLLAGLDRLQELAVVALSTPGAGLGPGISEAVVHRRLSRGRPAVYEHEIRRTFEMRRHRADVFHNPNPHAPAAPTRPWVQTLHDVIPLVLDDPVGAGLKRRFARFGPRYAAADRVIAISRHAADAGMVHLGIPARRIEVVHHGIGPEFLPGENPPADPPYLLMVSEYSHRKGLSEALGVLDALADAGYPHRLRIAGRVPPWARPEFDTHLAACRHRERVEVLGFVADLPALYQGATVHLVTSRYEGFGFPAVEAMACGVPVVSFDNSSLPEVVGDGGTLVADGDVTAFAKAVERLVDDHRAWQEAREAALQRARWFDWARAAEAHAQVYAGAAG